MNEALTAPGPWMCGFTASGEILLIMTTNQTERTVKDKWAWKLVWMQRSKNEINSERTMMAVQPRC